MSYLEEAMTYVNDKSPLDWTSLRRDKGGMTTIGERLKKLRTDKDMSQGAVARHIGADQSTVHGWERNRTQPKAHYLAKLAGLFGVSEAYLLIGETTVTSDAPLLRVKVVGDVQAGTWKTALEWPEPEQYEIMVSPPKVPVGQRYGLVVRGPSMNRIYPDGTTLVCVPLIDFYRELRSGDKVVVERYDGDVAEATVKELHQDDEGRLWLWPRSDHPEHQAPIPAPADHDENQDNGIRIAGVVIQSVRDEI